MKTASWKETFKRAGRTFIQAFAGYMAANLVTATAGLTDMDALTTALVGLGVSAVAAGLAAVMNLPVKT
jgi:hypothetical protein